jgi:C_GCAxxG_C_C family probable redox protein
MDDLERMRELKLQGFFCSQILMQMALDLQGCDNPPLVRAMHGLAGGLGFTGDICGALTGGVCVLGLYAGKGTPAQDDDPRLMFMIQDVLRWFRDGYGQAYGGLRCDKILEGDPNARVTRCPVMVAGTFQKVKDLLVENGYELSGPLDD